MLADTWNVRILRTAPNANTYNIISTKRTTCDSYLATFPCDKGTAVDVYTTVGHARSCTCWMYKDQPNCWMLPVLHQTQSAVFPGQIGANSLI